jgi:predicted  nucleic acid-binding Zn ribbon protein
MDEKDVYWKLRPMPPTPADELCTCVVHHPLMLQYHLTPNPIVCFHCGLEMSPEKSGMPQNIAETLFRWRNLHECFYRIWLDGNSLEELARTQLETLTSEVNQRAFALLREMNPLRRTYLYWFQDNTLDSYRKFDNCPNCQNTATEKDQRRVCEICSLVFASD